MGQVKVAFVLMLTMLLVPATSVAAQYKTKSGDTLWQIASKHRLHGVDVHTMIQAIKRQNPNAFTDANANSLRQSVTLSIPDSKQEVKKALAGGSDHSTQSTQDAADQQQQPAARETADHETSSAAAAAAERKSDSYRQQLLQAKNKIDYLENAQQQLLEQQDSGFSWGLFWFTIWLLTMLICLLRGKLATILAVVTSKRFNCKKPAMPSFIANFKFGNNRSGKMLDGQQEELDIGDYEHYQTKPEDSKVHDEQPYQVSILDDPEKERLHTLIRENYHDIERHMALLSYYVDNEAQNAFDEHVKEMLAEGLMVEGDSVWSRMRRMYLDAWVYDKKL